MNKPNDTDLREALRRREAKRMPTELSTDFADRVMREVNMEKARPKAKTWRIALASLAAACIAFAAMLTLPKSQPLPSLAGGGQRVEPVVHQPQLQLQASSPQVPKTEPARTHPANDSFARSKRSVCAVQTTRLRGANSPSEPSLPSEPAPADSLYYYISKVEQSLNDIRDSCYIANVERLIRADERLGRLVNQLILDGILADTLRTTALSR